MEVLRLDVMGVPQDWLSFEEAAGLYAADAVCWTVGDVCKTLRGGINARSGIQSTIDIHPIVATYGASKRSLFDCVPTLTNHKLFKRDRYTCALCAQVFKASELTREHIIPTSREGANSWSNCCTCCKGCNGAKGNRTLSEAGLTLAYLPYVPSLYEDFILAGRNIRADVHDWLLARVPKGSRLC